MDKLCEVCHHNVPPNDGRIQVSKSGRFPRQLEGLADLSIASFCRIVDLLDLEASLSEDDIYVVMLRWRYEFVRTKSHAEPSQEVPHNPPLHLALIREEPSLFLASATNSSDELLFLGAHHLVTVRLIDTAGSGGGQPLSERTAVGCSMTAWFTLLHDPLRGVMCSSPPSLELCGI